MKRYLMMALLGVVFLINFVPTTVLPQETTEAEYSWGIVTSVAVNQIVIREYDYDLNEEADVTYTLAPNVKLDNVDSLEDIAVGEEAWIDYVVKEGKKMAVNIEVKKYVDEEDLTTDEEAEY